MSLLTTFSRFDISVLANPADTYVFITPSMYVAEKIGEVFDMAINISKVENVRSLKFTVTYNASLLSAEQVIQGTFFPSPPKSHFEYEKNVVLGFVKVNISLASSESSLSGNGTLVWISLKAIQGLGSCSSSPIGLEQILLLDCASNPISTDSVGAVYFWKSMQPDPPLEGREMDLYTQKDGVGLNEPGGEFMIGEMVFLISVVTYNDYPMQNKLVAFEVLTPQNQTILVEVGISDEIGRAVIRFRIPVLPSCIGTWSVISTVEIAEVVAWDTLTFQVSLTPLPVGGLSYSTKVYTTTTPMTHYPTFVLIFVAIFTACKLVVHARAKRRRVPPIGLRS